MDPTIVIDKQVTVLALFAEDGRACTPLKMRYQNREYVFTEIGLVHPTQQGKRMVHVFDVSDGSNDFRLELDAERLSWRLVYSAEGTSHGRA